ncbi:uncharacterized protein LOC133189181 [Saccostrea echinata]|uniref:uncharacterized protein LOC133189181 n=1 Tax=Saccostrea echinata TaxID=191078 RepID=UPI002A825428|nr:uncharacterized protein LOC133189181 [Saccostrea echinata]
MEKDIEFDKSLHIKFRKCIQHISSFLYEKHLNLEIISASGFRSTKNGDEIVREPCIVFYCACKGIIPFGESEFPRNIYDFNTDVREGFFYQFPNDGFFKRSTDVLDPLMMGGSISSKDFSKGGTLGGFVTLNNGNIGFITCAHVLFDLSRLCRETEHFDVVQPAYTYKNTNNVCRIHELSCFPTTPFKGCTLDVSLVKLTNRIPEKGLFSDLSIEDLLENGFNMENIPEYTEGTIRDYRQDHFAHLRDPCFKWGAKTGFTRGALRLNGISVRWFNDVIDLGQPPSRYSFVYHSQLECLGTGTSFALPGDSGALVFQLDPIATKNDQHRFHCIGMIVGGTSDYKTVVTPIGPILEALNVKMHTFPQEKMDES